MGPTLAEVARTLAHGRLPGSLRIAPVTRLTHVHHATDAAGRPLVLARDGDPLAAALGRLAGTGRPGPAVELSVRDRAPVAGSPGLGSVRIVGRLRRFGATEAAAAVLEFADANPVTALLDVGRQATICRIDVEEVWLEPSPWLSCTDGSARGVSLGAYAETRPDPLHAIERDLLLDLLDHHTDQMESYLRCALGAAGLVCDLPPRPVRIDRYGFTVDTGGPDGERWIRVNFVRPVRDHHDLAHLLHPLLFHGQAH